MPRRSSVYATDLGLKEPYTGGARLVSGEIAEDLANYFAVSEQTPSAVALGVLVGTQGQVLISSGDNPEALLQRALAGTPYEVLDRMTLVLACRCNRERAAELLVSLGADELAEMVSSRDPVEMRCHFCGEIYTFEPAEVERLLEAARPAAEPPKGTDGPRGE